MASWSCKERSGPLDDVLSIDTVAIPKTIAKVIAEDYHITSIAFDQTGKAWLGTLGQGLLTYEKGVVTVYDSTNSILKNRSISDIKVDHAGNIWLGSDDLIKITGSTFTRFKASKFNLPANYVGSMVLDSKGNLWFSCSSRASGGLVKFNGSDFTTFTPENSGLPGNLIQDMVIDKADNIWLVMNDGIDSKISLTRLSSNDKWTVYDSDKLGFNPYYFGSLVINKKNEPVVSLSYFFSSAIQPGRPQIFRFDGKKAQILKLPNEESVVYYTSYIFIDRNDRVWAAFYGEKEYGVLKNKEWSFYDLPGEGVFSFAENKNGEMWLGTGKGVYILK